MLVKFFSDRIRLTFESGKIYLRVIGRNEEKGVPEALKQLARIMDSLKEQGVFFEEMQRNYRGKKKTDCIGINLKNRE